MGHETRKNKFQVRNRTRSDEEKRSTPLDRVIGVRDLKVKDMSNMES